MKTLKDILKEFDKADLSEEMDCENASEMESVHIVLSRSKVKSFLTKAITEALEDAYFQLEEPLMKEYNQALEDKRDDEANGYAHAIALAKKVLLKKKEKFLKK